MLFDFTKKSRAVGIDIADHTIEVAEVERDGYDMKILKLGRVKISPGVVENGKIQNKEKLTWAIREALLGATPGEIVPERVAFGLAESQMYTHIVSFDSAKYVEFSKTGKNLAGEIERKILLSVPLERENLIFSYKAYKKFPGAKYVDILTISADKRVLDEWVSIFNKQLGFNLEEVDFEMLALRRALVYDYPERSGNFMLVDIGEVKTTISIFDRSSRLRYSHSFWVAGDAMRDEIAKALGIGRKEAEELKIRTGLADPGGKIFNAIVKVLEKISKEIESSLGYFRKKYGEDLREIVFVGGSSQMIGLTEYFATNLGMAVTIGSSGEVVASVRGAEGRAFDSGRESGGLSNLLYLGAVGLAVRLLDDRWMRLDPSFKISDLYGAKPPKKTGKESADAKVSVDAASAVFNAPAGNTDDFEEKNQKEKLKRRKKILAAVVIFGILSIALAFFYREYERDSEKKELESELEEFQNTLDDLEEKLKEIESEKVFPEDAANGTSTEEKMPVEIDEVNVIINDTPTGWLNARSGPGLEYSKVGVVYPGEIYPLLNESGDWYKIELSDGKSGWVFNEYAHSDEL